MSGHSRRAAFAVIVCITAAAQSCSCSRTQARVFDTPEHAVAALGDAAIAGDVGALLTLFGPEATDIAASSDPVTARRNREVFVAAMREQWHLADDGGNRKILVVGNEQWPFPVPLVRDATGWRFDTAAGRDEIVARRIGRNELAAIDLCRTYVVAQRLYASRPHDGRPRGTYAAAFHSEPGHENGLFWPAAHGQRRSPLGDLVAQAAEDGTPLGGRREPPPFHGYYFRILTAQGEAAPGGARSYVIGGGLSGGFAMVAWPARYDVTGVMTFVVNQDGVVYEKDFGSRTGTDVQSLHAYNPDASWDAVR